MREGGRTPKAQCLSDIRRRDLWPCAPNPELRTPGTGAPTGVPGARSVRDGVETRNPAAASRSAPVPCHPRRRAPMGPPPRVVYAVGNGRGIRRKRHKPPRPNFRKPLFLSLPGLGLPSLGPVALHPLGRRLPCGRRHPSTAAPSGLARRSLEQLGKRLANRRFLATEFFEP